MPAQVPGAFVFLGARPARLSRDEAEENHSPRAEFDDVVLNDGARLLAELAVRRLNAYAMNAAMHLQATHVAGSAPVHAGGPRSGSPGAARAGGARGYGVISRTSLVVQPHQTRPGRNAPPASSR